MATSTKIASLTIENTEFPLLTPTIITQELVEKNGNFIPFDRLAQLRVALDALQPNPPDAKTVWFDDTILLQDASGGTLPSNTLTDTGITITDTTNTLSLNSTGIDASNNLVVSSNNLKLLNSNVSIGVGAGQLNQGIDSIAIGRLSAEENQNNEAISIGVGAGRFSQGFRTVALGYSAGYTNQGTHSVAVGYEAGQTQGLRATSVGHRAGQTSQGNDAVAIGNIAGFASQGANSVAIGNNAGTSLQNANSIAVGNGAGRNTQGTDCIAIGRNAGRDNQHNNSIVLNATGSNLNTDVSNAFFVAPMREKNGNYLAQYDTNNKEVSYSNIVDVSGNLLFECDTLIVDGNLDMSLNNITNVNDLTLTKNNMPSLSNLLINFNRDNETRAYVWYQNGNSSPLFPEMLRFGSGSGRTSWSIALRDPNGVSTNQVNQLSYGYFGWDPTSLFAINYDDIPNFNGQSITNIFRLQTGGTNLSQLLYTKDGKLSIGNSYEDVSNNGGYRLDINGKSLFRNDVDISGNATISTSLNCPLIKNTGGTIEINGTQLNLDATTIDFQNTSTTTSQPNHNAEIKMTSNGVNTTKFLKMKLNENDIWIPYFETDPSL